MRNPFQWAGVLLVSLLATSALAENVKVRLKTKTNKVNLSGFQIQMPYDDVGGVKPADFQKRKITLQRILQNGRIVWEISDSELEDKVYWRDEPLRIKGEMLRQGVEPLPRDLVLHPLDTRAFDVVAIMDVESYLQGVLPSEMPSSWPMEALKAQVVASRSYMYAIMRERRNSHFQLESSIFDQVYNHGNRVNLPAKVQERMRKAIRDTQGDVLFAESGEILKSFYHADCGGKTEEPKYVWGMPKKNGTVEDDSCPASPLARWELNLHRSTLRKHFAEYFDWNKSTEFKAVLVAQRTPSGRVADLQVLTNEGPLTLPAQEFRKLLGFNRLKSTNFQLHWNGDRLNISGRGHGHGVGMCQWGARSLAQKGSNYRDILKRYYPYSSLGKVDKPQPKTGPQPAIATVSF